MGIDWEKLPDGDGDAPARSPHSEIHSLLAANSAGAARRLTVDASRNLKVTQGGAAGVVSALSQATASSVPSGTLTVVTSFTATATTAITKISCSGSDYGQFRLLLASVVIDVRRSGPTRNTDFLFEYPLKLTTGQTLEVKVIHQDASVSPDFDATIYGV